MTLRLAAVVRLNLRDSADTPGLPDPPGVSDVAVTARSLVPPRARSR
jgi:hypothetical protein